MLSRDHEAYAYLECPCPGGILPWMDIRDGFPAHGALARLNARHPWSHNEYFHRWILRNLPAGRDAAVDIGCGAGVLAAKLATCFAHVTGIDPDEGMAATAGARLAGVPGASVRRCRFNRARSGGRRWRGGPDHDGGRAALAGPQ